jgi:putative FmdB family regulatory protein
MPIYEYQCGDCRNEFSRLQPIGANADGMRCPKCKSPEVERQLSTFASTSSSPDVACPAASTCSSGFS